LAVVTVHARTQVLAKAYACSRPGRWTILPCCALTTCAQMQELQELHEMSIPAQGTVHEVGVGASAQERLGALQAPTVRSHHKGRVALGRLVRLAKHKVDVRALLNLVVHACIVAARRCFVNASALVRMRIGMADRYRYARKAKHTCGMPAWCQAGQRSLARKVADSADCITRAAIASAVCSTRVYVVRSRAASSLKMARYSSSVARGALTTPSPDADGS
jgi:hypothetical protein